MLLLEHEDWTGFKKWSTVEASLYCGMIPGIPEERDYCDGTIWRKLLQRFDDDNGTAIRQAYSLAMYEDVTGHQITSEDHYFSFHIGTFMLMGAGRFILLPVILPCHRERNSLMGHIPMILL